MDNGPSFGAETDAQILELMDTIRAVRFSDLDREYQACTELLALSKRENYLYGEAYAYAYMGDCLVGKNESVNASGYLTLAKKLCETHRFLDLLPYVCTWLGLYYEMQNDRQMAMQNFLDALEFAERSGDLMRQSILLNNIASQFQSCGNYQVAKEYYMKSLRGYNDLETASRADPHYAQMTTNLVSVCCRLEQIDEAEYYLALLDKSGQLEANQNQLYLCQLLIAVAVGDLEATRESVDKLLLEMQKETPDIHQFFETFLLVAESMINLKEVEYARMLLTKLNNLCKENEYGHQLRVQYVWMRFYRNFGTQEEKNNAYVLFYELREKSDAILNQNLSDGLLSKIKLRESVKRNVEIEKAKEMLEGEVQTDELTQLFNRRSFRKLSEQIASDPKVHTLGVIMLDVDYFKQYNDTYGHTRGDEVLRTVAASMTEAADGDIYSFRYGGDEFFALCRNKTAEEMEAYIVALTALLQERQIPHAGSQCSDVLTLSIGYSVQKKHNGQLPDANELLAEADKALYRAKWKGRNGYYLYCRKEHRK